MTPTWLSAFIDLAPEAHRAGLDFWQKVTGFEVSPPRGDAGEFVTLVPPAGGAYLKVQRLGRGPSRLHLDLHVSDPRVAADAAIATGAREVGGPGGEGLDHVVLTSPGGLTFCFVGHTRGSRPAPVSWGEHHSMVYQVCIDIPAESWNTEAAFWTEILGGKLIVLERRPEFAWVRPDRSAEEAWALDVLLQRLDQPTGVVSAHLDLGANNRALEDARHRDLGAERLVEEVFWTLMRDPAGLRYCVTGRDPITGRL